MSRRVLLVDGYNVIRLTPPYRDLAQRDLDSARVALVSDVAAYAGDEWDATVVFDGGNTLWASQMVKRFLEMNGTGLADYYASRARALRTSRPGPSRPPRSSP